MFSMLSIFVPSNKAYNSQIFILHLEASHNRNIVINCDQITKNQLIIVKIAYYSKLGSVSKLHERTKLHEGTKLHEDTFARGDTFARADNFARRHFCTGGSLLHE